MVVTLEKTGEGPVRAGDISDNPMMEILNPDHVICNVSGGSIKMELKVSQGKGYVTALDNKDSYDLLLVGFTWIHFFRQFIVLIIL